MTLVDSNVLLDLTTRDPNWLAWSARQLEAASIAGPVAIDDAVYAEVSVGFDRMADVDAWLDRLGVDIAPMPRAALFLASEVFRKYRRAGGVRTGVLPDFFIGAHAEVAGIPLLTRDVRRYRTYFPNLRLIAPRS